MKDFLSAADSLYLSSLKTVNLIADLKKRGAALYPQTVEIVNALADAVENYERVRWRKKLLLIEFPLPPANLAPSLAPHKGWAALRSKRRKNEPTLEEPGQPPENPRAAGKKHA